MPFPLINQDVYVTTEKSQGYAKVLRPEEPVQIQWYYSGLDIQEELIQSGLTESTALKRLTDSGMNHRSYALSNRTEAVELSSVRQTTPLGLTHHFNGNTQLISQWDPTCVISVSESPPKTPRKKVVIARSRNFTPVQRQALLTPKKRAAPEIESDRRRIRPKSLLSSYPLKVPVQIHPGEFFLYQEFPELLDVQYNLKTYDSHSFKMFLQHLWKNSVYGGRFKVQVIESLLVGSFKVREHFLDDQDNPHRALTTILPCTPTGTCGVCGMNRDDRFYCMSLDMTMDIWCAARLDLLGRFCLLVVDSRDRTLTEGQLKESWNQMMNYESQSVELMKLMRRRYAQ